MKKRLWAMLMVTTLTISMTACGNTGDKSGNASNSSASVDDSEKIKVALVCKQLSDEHWALLKKGAEQAASDLGIEADVIGPKSESDVQQQVEMIENELGSGIDALGIAPATPDAVVTALQQADSSGVPVITVDTDLPDYANKKSFVGTGGESAGRMGGEYAASIAGVGGKAIILRGRAGDTTHDQREAGIIEGLKSGGVEVLEIRDCMAEAEKAMNAMQDMIVNYEQIDVVVTTCDTMAQGAQRAIEGANRDIPVVGFDGTASVVELVEQGSVIKATVAQAPYEMGYLAIETMVQLAKGKDVEERIDSGATLVTKDNAEEYMKGLQEKINS